MPTSAGAAFTALTSPCSWSSIPMKWPRRWVKYAPYPAAAIESRAAASISRRSTPGRTRARARSLASRTRSWMAAYRGSARFQK